MIPVALSDVVAVGEMPTAEGVAILAKAGFRSILNSQPDGEVQRHIAGADLQAAAKANGLGYAYVPTETRRPDEATIVAFKAAATDLPKPIYACCYSGSRSAALWALAIAKDAQPDAIIKACQDAGYSIDFLRDELAERHAGQIPTRVKVAAQLEADAVKLAALEQAAGEVVDGNAPAEASATQPATKPAVVQTSTAHGSAVAPGSVNGSAAPALLKNPIVVPRAASAGGFAVPG